MSAPAFHILCVDDEPNILRSLGRVFRREGYQLHFAGSASEALKVLEEHPVDVVISDNRMPQMTGVQLFGVVKERWPETVRIILSGYAEVGSITQAINEGHIYKFILKPWDDDKLLATVREALNVSLWARQSQQLRKMEGERRQVLSEALSLAQAILDTLPVPVIGVSGDTIVFSNKAAEKSFAKGGSLLVARVRDVFSGGLEDQIKQVHASREATEFEFAPAGGLKLRAMCAPLPDPLHQEGAVVCFLSRDLCDQAVSATQAAPVEAPLGGM